VDIQNNNSIGFLLNGVYGLNLPPWPSKPCTLVVSHLSDLLWHYNTHEVSALIQFSSAFSPPSQLNIWILCFSICRSKSLEFITCQYPWISVTFYFQTSSKNILLSVSLPPFSCPPCLEYLPPCALILLRLWRYISHARTYLLTY